MAKSGQCVQPDGCAGRNPYMNNRWWSTITALLPTAVHSSVIVKRSTRQRGSKWIWWHTIMAPSEVMQQIEEMWSTLTFRSA